MPWPEPYCSATAPLPPHDAVDRARDELAREGGHEGHAAGQGDHLGAGGDGEQGSDLGGAQAGGAVGVVVVPRVEVGALCSVIWHVLFGRG